MVEWCLTCDAPLTEKKKITMHDRDSTPTSSPDRLYTLGPVSPDTRQR